MQRFQVPQFINIEDKIVGPLSAKQLVYIVGGLGMGYLAYEILPAILNIVFGIIGVLFGVALAFGKYNGRPLIKTLQAAVNFIKAPRKFVWRQQQDSIVRSRTLSKKEAKEAQEQENHQAHKQISRQKVDEIAWGLDVLDKSTKRNKNS